MKIPVLNFDYTTVLGISYTCILFLTGGLCVFTGFMADEITDDYRIFSPLNFFAMSSTLSIAGMLILFAGILCLFASFKRNTWLLIIIGLTLGIPISMELFASISGLNFNRNTPEVVERKMYASMRDYHEGYWKVVRAWDKLQNTFQCCGTENVTDWVRFEWLNKWSIPKSCCTSLDPCKEYHAGGCASVISNLVIDQTVKSSRIGIASALVQVTGLFAIFFVHALIKRMVQKQRNNDTTFLQANLDGFTIDPYSKKLENEKRIAI